MCFMSLKAYLTFSKRERIGILALVVILLFVAVLPRLIPSARPEPEILPSLAIQKTPWPASVRGAGGNDSLLNANEPGAADQRTYERGGSDGYGAYPYKKKPYWTNTYPRKNYTDNRYANTYRERRKWNPADGQTDRKPFGANSYPQREWTPRPHTPVQINTADTSAFIALPGIGSKLALRIVSFREKLGGFNRVDQIGEVYGLRDSVFRTLIPLLRCDSSFVKKLLVTYNTSR
jgi:competence protein ComEA